MYDIPVLDNDGKEIDLKTIIDNLLVLFYMADNTKDVSTINDALSWFLNNGGEFDERQEYAYKLILFDKKLSPASEITLSKEESDAIDAEIDAIVERMFNPGGDAK